MSLYKIEPLSHQAVYWVHELLLDDPVCETLIPIITNANTIVILKDALNNPLNLEGYEIYVYADDEKQTVCLTSLCRVVNTKQGILLFDLNQILSQTAKQIKQDRLYVHLCHAHRQPYCIQLNINPLIQG